MALSAMLIWLACISAAVGLGGACGILAMENTRKFGLKRKMENVVECEWQCSTPNCQML
jgi:hypothetical protein